jgi:hypothetical protein
MFIVKNVNVLNCYNCLIVNIEIFLWSLKILVWRLLIKITNFSSISGQNEQRVKSKYNASVEISKKMQNVVKNSRPNCSEVMDQRNSWYLNIEDISREIESMTLIEYPDIINWQNIEFYKYFLRKKLLHRRNKHVYHSKSILITNRDSFETDQLPQQRRASLWLLCSF